MSFPTKRFGRCLASVGGRAKKNLGFGHSSPHKTLKNALKDALKTNIPAPPNERAHERLVCARVSTKRISRCLASADGTSEEDLGICVKISSQSTQICLLKENSVKRTGLRTPCSGAHPPTKSFTKCLASVEGASEVTKEVLQAPKSKKHPKMLTIRATSVLEKDFLTNEKDPSSKTNVSTKEPPAHMNRPS